MQTKTDKCSCQMRREEEEKKEFLATPLFFKATHLLMLLQAMKDVALDYRFEGAKMLDSLKDAERICKNIYKQSCVMHSIDPYD